MTFLLVIKRMKKASNNSIKCISKDCYRHNALKLENLAVIPFEYGKEEIESLFSYFLYKAPNIESVHSPQISSKYKREILDRMISNQHYRYQCFCKSNSPIEKELVKANLSDGDGVCLKCKRFVCKKKKKKGAVGESDLDCFLRHIRNSIAHGRVYLWRDGNKHHIMFEDENNTGKISARIVCVKSDLSHWKKVLNDKKYII